MSLVSVTRSLLAEKLFEAKIDQTQLPINTAGQIIRVLVLTGFAAFCFGQLVKSKAVHSFVTHSGIAAARLAVK
jgi:hypothetical protein